MNSIRLILVDDHTLFTEGLSTALVNEGNVEVIATFSEAKEALNFLSHTLPDLLITDISMPDMHGLEFIDKVKKQSPDLKILVVSMYPQLVSSKYADGCLSKSVGIEKFLEAIQKIVIEEDTYFPEEVPQSDSEIFINSVLTKREKDVVKLIAKENTVDEMARKLHVSRSTVETHKRNIFFKLNVNSNAGLVKKAVQLGFLEEGKENRK